MDVEESPPAAPADTDLLSFANGSQANEIGSISQSTTLNELPSCAESTLEPPNAPPRYMSFHEDMDAFDYFSGLDLVQIHDAMSFQSILSTKGELTSRVIRERTLQQRKLFEDRLRKRHEAIRRKLVEPSFVMSVDKVTFVGSIVILLILEFVLFTRPQHMGLAYVLLIFPLLIIRYIMYRKDKYQYFTYDFCYFAQISLLFLLFMMRSNAVALQNGDSAPFAPGSVHRWLALNFAVSNGPLAFAVIVWRNSIVFHSLDKMTSTYIHLLPPLVTYCIRWHDNINQRKFTYTFEPWGDAGSVFLNLFALPFGYYLLWQCLYLFKTEVISRRKLQNDPELMTSFRWMTRNKKSAMFKLINSLGETYQLLCFVLLQLAYTALTLLLPMIVFHNMMLHAVFLLVVFLVGLWNGAGYYFSVFATKYFDELMEKKEKKDYKNQTEGGQDANREKAE